MAKTVNEKVNEVENVVVEATEEMKENLSTLNAKDVAITLGLGTLIVGAGYGLYSWLFKGKKIEFKLPFAKKQTITEVAEEAVETLTEEVKS